MRRSIIVSLTAACLLFTLTVPAYAGDWVQGDVYRFRLPDGFESLDLSAVGQGEDLEQALDLFDNMFGSFMDADFHLYVRNTSAKPDAYLAAMAFELKGRAAEMMSGQMNLDQFEAQFQMALDQGQLPIEDGSVRRITVSGGHPALELEVTAPDAQLGGVSKAHVMFMFDDGAMVMMMFQGRIENEVADGALWRGVVASFSLDGQSSIVRLLLKYGPFVLGGLVLLLAFVLLRRPSGGYGRTSMGGACSVPGREPAASGAGFSRPLDGLPVYGMSDGPPASGGPAAAPAANGLGLGAAAPAGTSPQMRTIPRSTVSSAVPGVPETAEASGSASEEAQEPSRLSLDSQRPPPPPAPPPPGPLAGVAPGPPPLRPDEPPSPPRRPDEPPPPPPPPPPPAFGTPLGPVDGSPPHRAPTAAPPPIAEAPLVSELLPTNVARRDASALSNAADERDAPPPPQEAQEAQALKIQRNEDYL